MSRSVLLATAGVIASQAASGLVPQSARFDGSTNYVSWSASNILGAANAKFFAVGCFKLPSESPAFTDADRTLWTVNVNTRTRLLYIADGNKIGFALRANAAPFYVFDASTNGTFSLDATLANDLDKLIAYLIQVDINAGSPIAYLRFKKDTSSAIADWTAPTPSTGTMTQTAAFSGFIVGATADVATKAAVKVGPLWTTPGITPITGTGDFTVEKIWDDFFGVGSNAAGVACVPQWIGGNGAFTGAASGTVYAQPAFMVDWIDLVNNGTSGGTGTETGTPIYGAL